MLDSQVWSVTYDEKTGDYILTRGAKVGHVVTSKIENAIDDLSDIPSGSDYPDRAKRISQVIKRDNKVRAYAIKRANGRCEFCKVKGFPTINGGFYLEAHHIIALCDSGRDTIDNVIALCPQHHRQAHFGADGEALEAEFIIILKKLAN